MISKKFFISQASELTKKWIRHNVIIDYYFTFIFKRRLSNYHSRWNLKWWSILRASVESQNKKSTVNVTFQTKGLQL